MPFQLRFDFSAMNDGTRKSLSVNCCLIKMLNIVLRYGVLELQFLGTMYATFLFLLST